MNAKKYTIQAKPIVGLYSDIGVAPNSFFQLQKLLSPYYTVVKLKAPDIIQQNWPEAMKALVMPGGADIPYHQKLQGKGCTNIRAFVETGGVYVGVCAGSYFAADEVYFTYADGKIIQGTRELRFFKGCVVGPAFGNYVEETHASAKLVPVVLEGNTVQAYFNGGGVFEGGQNNEILGVYQETNLPMAVRCKIGKGYALLCAVHPEYDMEFLVSVVASKAKGYEVLEMMLQTGPSIQVKHWFLKMLGELVLEN